MKKLISIYVISSLLIAGCGTVTKDVRPITTGQTRTLTVLVKDPATGVEISNSSIFAALTQSAIASTGYIRQENSYYNGGRYTKGVRVENAEGGFAVYYVDDYESLKRNASGLFKVSIASVGDMKRIVVSCPAEITMYDSFKVGFLDGKRWYTEESVSADLGKICNSLGIIISGTKYVRGELNVDYPSDSVFANYSRKFKSINVTADSVKGYDIEKAKYFNIGDGKRQIGAAISVFPYRKGSKVLYGFKFPYEILGDGTTTYRADKISDLEKTLVAVAND